MRFNKRQWRSFFTPIEITPYLNSITDLMLLHSNLFRVGVRSSRFMLLLFFFFSLQLWACQNKFDIWNPKTWKSELMHFYKIALWVLWHDDYSHWDLMWLFCLCLGVSASQMLSRFCKFVQHHQFHHDTALLLTR